MHIARKLAYLVLELVLGGFDFSADSLAYLIDLFGQFRVAFELFHFLAFHFQRSNPDPRCSSLTGIPLPL